MRKKVCIGLVVLMMTGLVTSCGSSTFSSNDMFSVSTESTEEIDSLFEESKREDNSSKSDDTEEVTEEKTTEEDTENDTTEKDNINKTTVDISDGDGIELSDGEDITISEEGTYVLSGEASDVTIYVEAGDEDEVEIILNGVNIENESAPAIYVKSADKVTVETTNSDNSLSVVGTFEADDDTNLDAVIFSKEDLDIQGDGTLNISSTDNGISSKDSIDIEGGTINIECTGNAIEAHDDIEVKDGTVIVSSCNDGIHAEDSDDDSVGAVYITGGTIEINANDDGIHGTTTVQIDDGNITLTAAECIEATYITVNGGTINITASDDGINAASKSSAYTPTYEMNGGEVTITMGAGDTDGVDSNGNIYINGGTIDISGQSTFDYDGNAEYNGGTIIENGEETNTITNQFFGGGGFGGPGDGGFGGGFGGGMNDH